MLPPSSTQVHLDLEFARVLDALGYLGDDGTTYEGHPWATAEQYYWNGREWTWKEDPNLKLLREDPDSPPLPHPEGNPRDVLSRLQLKVVAYNPENPPKSSRDKRRLRTATAQHGYRRFRQWGPSSQVMRCPIVIGML